MYDLLLIRPDTAPVKHVLSGWGQGETIEVKLRRPTIYAMASAGLIPNPLMSEVTAMFSGNPKAADSIDPKKQAQVLFGMAKYAMLEPTLDEVRAAGLELTDQQLMEIYAFALGGANGLATFRSLSGGDTEHAVERVSLQAE